MAYGPQVKFRSRSWCRNGAKTGLIGKTQRWEQCPKPKYRTSECRMKGKPSAYRTSCPGTVFVVIAIPSYFLWEMFSESAALSRLSATAAIFHYTVRCDADGNPVATGQPHGVDLNRYVLVHGPIHGAFRRACSGKKAGILSFEEGKVPRSEINSVQKELQFRARNGSSSPC